ncbi:MAG: polysaccharide biosynthesis C-terminal domain-containing protein [Erysipelotrichaceae bacterium]|nr:polysaccharide biosynthesis C-terminal domain-containing protein [Erysipelotrichaceae bacterium]
MNIRSYIGDGDFYKKVYRIALPCALSQLLLSCRSIICSIMVSSIGMVTAVGNANNIVYLHDYLLWGFEAGAALFGAQFFGAGNYKNMARTQGLFLVSSLLNAFFWIAVVFLFGDKLLLFYLNDEVLMPYSWTYLRYVMISLIFMCITTSFRSMYQAMHRTRVAFAVSTFYVALNILCNYVFIYILHKGVAGAGMAVLLSEMICCIVTVAYALHDRPVFLAGIREMFSFRSGFVIPFIGKVLPIAFNEMLFGFGQSLFNKAYGMLGSSSMEVIYVSSEILSLALFAVWGYGEAVSIIVGTLLGEGRIEQAKEESRYHLGLSFAVGAALWVFMVAMSPVFLRLYHISDPLIHAQCTKMLAVYGFKAFLRVFTYVMFCTLKAGGDSKIYNLLDSGIMYAVGIPIAFAGVYLGMKDVVLLVLFCQMEQVVRFILTLKRYNSYKWANNLTELVN